MMQLEKIEHDVNENGQILDFTKFKDTLIRFQKETNTSIND